MIIVKDSTYIIYEYNSVCYSDRSLSTRDKFPTLWWSGLLNPLVTEPLCLEITSGSSSSLSSNRLPIGRIRPWEGCLRFFSASPSMEWRSLRDRVFFLVWHLERKNHFLHNVSTCPPDHLQNQFPLTLPLHHPDQYMNPTRSSSDCETCRIGGKRWELSTSWF